MKRFLVIILAIMATSLLLPATALAQDNGACNALVCSFTPPERTDTGFVGPSLHIEGDNGLEVSVDGPRITFTEQKGQDLLPAVQIPEVEAITPSD